MNKELTKKQLKEAREFYFGPADYDQAEQDKYEAPRRPQTAQENPYDSHTLCWDSRPSDAIWESPKFDRNFWKYLEKNHADVLEYFINNSNWMMCGPELLNHEMFYSLWHDYKDKVHPDTGKRMEGRDIIYQYLYSIDFERNSDNIWTEYLKKNNLF